MSGVSSVESAAKKKRRPFVVKSSEGDHNVYCLLHADEVATFYCMLCHKPHCEACVGGERGDETVCSSCVESGIQDEIQDDVKKHRRRLILWWLFGGVAAVILAVNIFFIVGYGPSSQIITEPQVSSKVSLIVECRHRLEVLAEHARVFQQSMEKDPESMVDVRTLVEDQNMLLEPVSSKPYLLHVEKGQIKIQCPNPGAHGLADLYAVPRKPAKMILIK